MREASSKSAAILLKKGSVGVLPTDTLYGLVASALDPVAVERVYRIRGRDEGKPCIVLISDAGSLDRFGVSPSDPVARLLEELWPGKVSVILPCPDTKWTHLHRGTGTVAFRVPDKSDLRELLRETGPLIAPSANPQGMPPAKTVGDAEKYFGDGVDFYADGGTLDSEPSTVVKIENEKLSVVRQGAVEVAGSSRE